MSRLQQLFGSLDFFYFQSGEQFSLADIVGNEKDGELVVFLHGNLRSVDFTSAFGKFYQSSLEKCHVRFVMIHFDGLSMDNDTMPVSDLLDMEGTIFDFIDEHYSFSFSVECFNLDPFDVQRLSLLTDLSSPLYSTFVDGSCEKFFISTLEECFE